MMSTPTQRLRLRATVVMASGERVRIDAVCPSRAALETVIEYAYPDARMVSIIVKRGGQ